MLACDAGGHGFKTSNHGWDMSVSVVLVEDEDDLKISRYTRTIAQKFNNGNLNKFF